MNSGLIHNYPSLRARKRAAKWRLAGIIKISLGCIDCGYNSHPEALQFDHINDDKKDNVSNLIRSDYAWSTILTEINKCEVRCSNCHAVVTEKRRDSLRMLERFESKINKTEDCWIWTASKDSNGYGVFRLDGKLEKAHRVSYTLVFGDISKDLVLDHLCRNKSCVKIGRAHV